MIAAAREPRSTSKSWAGRRRLESPASLAGVAAPRAAGGGGLGRGGGRGCGIVEDRGGGGGGRGGSEADAVPPRTGHPGSPAPLLDSMAAC